MIEGDGVSLRPTTSADLDAASRLFQNPGFYEYWDSYPKSEEEVAAKYLGARSPKVECFFVEIDDSIVGFAQYHVADNESGGGMDLVLLPAFRGRGIGTAVVRATVAHVREQLGWCRFTVDPAVSNERGVNFWKRVGFVPERMVDTEADRQPYWLLRWPETK